jgi:hypothetical protein
MASCACVIIQVVLYFSRVERIVLFFYFRYIILNIIDRKGQMIIHYPKGNVFIKPPINIVAHQNFNRLQKIIFLQSIEGVKTAPFCYKPLRF